MPPKVIVKLPPAAPIVQRISSQSHGNKHSPLYSSITKSPSNKASNESTSRSKRRCQFLEDLPGEVRNKIYELVVEYRLLTLPSFRNWQGVRVFPNDDPGHPSHHRLGARANALILNPLHLSKDECTWLSGMPLPNALACCETYWNTKSHQENSVLLLVCRQIYQEAVSIVYSHTTFAFGSLRYVTKKLLNQTKKTSNLKHSLKPGNIIPIRSSNLPFITSIWLQCVPHGAPAYTKDIHLQDQYYESWSKACGQLVEQLPALRCLRLFIGVPIERPIRLVLADKWVKPFLEFAQCKGLAHIAVHLFGADRFIDNELQEVFAKVIRRKILGLDDASALEAITDAKNRNLVSFAGKSLRKDLEFMEQSNGVETQKENNDSAII